MRPIEAPRLGRSLIAQLVVIALALVGMLIFNALSRARVNEVVKIDEPTPKPERTITIAVERIEPPRASPQLAKATAEPTRQPRSPAVRTPRAAAKPQQQPPRSSPHTIAADQSDIRGVPLRVLVPSDASSFESHLKRSGACLVVSRLDGSRAEIVDTFEISSGKAKRREREPCSGVPRIVRDHTLNRSLGDPLGQASARLRAEGAPSGELVLQVVLSYDLLARADAALRGRLGDVAPDELARRALAQGYEVKCFAGADGSIVCL